MSGIDFKVDNYSIEDLLEIFGITTALPQNEIIELGSGMIEKYRQQNKPNYVNFFSKATNKLLSNYRKVEEFFGTISDSEDEQEGFVGSRLPNTSNPRPKNMLPAENVWQHNQSGSLASNHKHHYEGRRDLTHVPTNLDHSVQLRRKLMLPNAYSQVPFAQGTMNPTLQNTYLTWVNVDSQFRDIISTTRQSTSCSNQVISSPVAGSMQQGSATDFIFTLNEPITNVLSMSLGSLELPLKGYYVFSNSKGNTTFDIKFTWGDIGYLQNNEDFANQLDDYIQADASQVYIRTGIINEYNPCMPPLEGVCACIGRPCAHDNDCKFNDEAAVDCPCDLVDGRELPCPHTFKPPKGITVPDYSGPWFGQPKKWEQLIEQWGNFGYFTSTNEVKDLYVPKTKDKLWCAQLPQGNYQNSTTTKAHKIEDYLTLAIQGVVGPQMRPSNPTLTNIWTPNTSDKNTNPTFIKSFISEGSGKPFFSINGSFDWWINQTLPLCVPTATFLRAPRIGMNPPGFGGGFWSPWMQGNTSNVVPDVGANYYTLGTPVPCKFSQRMVALTPKEIWGRVGKQYTGGQQASDGTIPSCSVSAPTLGGAQVDSAAISMANTPPASIGFNLLDMDIFGRFIYCWNEIVCNWAHTNVYDLFVLGPDRWRAINTSTSTPKLTSQLVFGGTNNSWSTRSPWIFAKNHTWEAKNYMDQLPLTFEQFLKKQPGYEDLTIASISGGVGYWNVSKNHEGPLPDKAQMTKLQVEGTDADLSNNFYHHRMYGTTSEGTVWPFVYDRPIDPNGWQHGLDTRTTEGYWHNKNNFDPQDLSWQQLCTNSGGWFGVGGEIPYAATTYVRGCTGDGNNSQSTSKSCVLKCSDTNGGIRDDDHFPNPYGPSYYALDPAHSNDCWGCSTVGASATPLSSDACASPGASAPPDASGASSTLSAVFAHCQGATWADKCSDTNCRKPKGMTGGIWCAQSAVGSGLPAAPQTVIQRDASAGQPRPRTQWSNGLIPPFSLNQVQTYVLYYIDKVLIPMAAENREQIWNANHYPAKMPPTLIALMIKTTRQWLWLGGVRQQAFQESTKKYNFPLILPWPFPFCHGFPNYIHPPITWMTQSTFTTHADAYQNSWYSAAKSLTRPFSITSPGFLPHLPRFDIQWYNPCDPLGGSCDTPTCANATSANQNKGSATRKQNGSLGWNLGFTDFTSSATVKFFEGDFANGTYPEGFVEHSILQTGKWATTDISGFEFVNSKANENLPRSTIFKTYADTDGQEWKITGAPPWIYIQAISCMTDNEKEEWKTERIANATLYGETLSLGQSIPISSGVSARDKEYVSFDALAPGQGPGDIITNEINPSPWSWNFWAACGITKAHGWNAPEHNGGGGDTSEPEPEPEPEPELESNGTANILAAGLMAMSSAEDGTSEPEHESCKWWKCPQTGCTWNTKSGIPEPPPNIDGETFCEEHCSGEAGKPLQCSPAICTCAVCDPTCGHDSPPPFESNCCKWGAIVKTEPWEQLCANCPLSDPSNPSFKCFPHSCLCEKWGDMCEPEPEPEGGGGGGGGGGAEPEPEGGGGGGGGGGAEPEPEGGGGGGGGGGAEPEPEGGGGGGGGGGAEPESEPNTCHPGECLTSCKWIGEGEGSDVWCNSRCAHTANYDAEVCHSQLCDCSECTKCPDPATACTCCCDASGCWEAINSSNSRDVAFCNEYASTKDPFPHVCQCVKCQNCPQHKSTTPPQKMSPQDIIAHCIRDAKWAKCNTCGNEAQNCWPKAACCDSSNNCTCDTSGIWQIFGVHPRYCNETGRFKSGGPPWPWAWPHDAPPPNTIRHADFWTTHNVDPVSNHAFLEPWTPEWIQRCYITGWTYYKLLSTNNSTAGQVCMTETIDWEVDSSCTHDFNCSAEHFPPTIPAPNSNNKSQLVPLYVPEINIVPDLKIPTSNCNAVWMGITSNRVINLNGTNYVTLIIDEFNKNRYVGNMPGMPLPSSQQHFKAPSYAKQITQHSQQLNGSFPVCTIPPMCCPSGNTFALTAPQITINGNTNSAAQRIKRAYRKGTQNPNDIIDGNSNITKAQKFTAQQIANHQSQKLLNQHLSPNLSNVLIRLPLERWQMSQGGQLVLMPPYNTSSGGRGMGRRYYGPVTIKRLHIKIVDDHGDTLDLTQGNVSFSLLLERLYQY